MKKKYMTLQRKMSEISLNWGKKIDENTVKNTRNLFRLKKENKVIKDINLDIKNLFAHEENDHYKPVRIGIFWVTIILNMKVTMTEIRHCQLKYDIIELGNT